MSFEVINAWVRLAKGSESLMQANVLFVSLSGSFHSEWRKH